MEEKMKGIGELIDKFKELAKPYGPIAGDIIGEGLGMIKEAIAMEKMERARGIGKFGPAGSTFEKQEPMHQPGDVVQSVKGSGHVYHQCAEANCQICRGGLCLCVVCGGAEASLPTDCPGKKMMSETQDCVQDGSMDFKDGSWVFKGTGVIDEVTRLKEKIKSLEVEKAKLEAYILGIRKELQTIANRRTP